MSSQSPKRQEPSHNGLGSKIHESQNNTQIREVVSNLQLPVLSPAVFEGMVKAKARRDEVALSQMKTAAEKWVDIEDPKSLMNSIAITLRGLEEHFCQFFYRCSITKEDLEALIHDQNEPNELWSDRNGFSSYYNNLWINEIKKEQKSSSLSPHGTSWYIVESNLFTGVANFMASTPGGIRLSEIHLQGFSQRLEDKQQLCLQVLTTLTTAGVMAKWLKGCHDCCESIARLWARWIEKFNQSTSNVVTP